MQNKSTKRKRASEPVRVDMLQLHRPLLNCRHPSRQPHPTNHQPQQFLPPALHNKTSTLTQMHRSVTLQNQSPMQMLLTLQHKPPMLTRTCKHRLLHLTQKTQYNGYRKPRYSVKSKVITRLNVCKIFVACSTDRYS